MQTSSTSPEVKQCVKRLRSRFERWELTHLRELAASLHEQLEEVTERLEDAELAASWADRRADMFQDMQNGMEEALERCGQRRGLTIDGELVLIPHVPMRMVCDDFGNLVEVAA